MVGPVLKSQVPMRFSGPEHYLGSTFHFFILCVIQRKAEKKHILHKEICMIVLTKNDILMYDSSEVAGMLSLIHPWKDVHIT